jgi:hypothetical protein
MPSRSSLTPRTSPLQTQTMLSADKVIAPAAASACCPLFSRTRVLEGSGSEEEPPSGRSCRKADQFRGLPRPQEPPRLAAQHQLAVSPGRCPPNQHHRNSGWVGPAAHDQPQPLRPEIGWQVRRLGWGQVRIIRTASTPGVAFPLPRAARRNRLQHGRQIRVRAKALGENGKAGSGLYGGTRGRHPRRFGAV